MENCKSQENDKSCSRRNEAYMGLRYKVWADSCSKIAMPDDVYPFYDNIDAAHDVACDLAHEHDGHSYRAIFHVEDLVEEETVDTIENINKTWQ